MSHSWNSEEISLQRLVAVGKPYFHFETFYVSPVQATQLLILAEIKMSNVLHEVVDTLLSNLKKQSMIVYKSEFLRHLRPWLVSNIQAQIGSNCYGQYWK